MDNVSEPLKAHYKKGYSKELINCQNRKQFSLAAKNSSEKHSCH